MRSIPKERILRVNCPGFGQDGYWDLGSTKPLSDYSVIIVNPTSISHLFQKDHELTRAAEQSILDGAVSYEYDSDEILQEMSSDVDGRILELSEFLTAGGLLIYFLCRPFVIKGPTLALDNYYWLESLAPDQPTNEKNVRHMSAVSHGRLVEPTSNALHSEFGTYLTQNALEWSTLIRSEFLNEGYQTLATAGAKKCIAGQLYIVGSSGRVVFLPSPFSPDFERSLMDCILAWYNKKTPSQDELEAERAAEALDPDRETSEESRNSGYAPAEQPSRSVLAGQIHSTPRVENEELIFSSKAEEDARKFEEDVAQRVSDRENRTTGGIDLSVFAQTAQQLVKGNPIEESKPTSQEEVSDEISAESQYQNQEFEDSGQFEDIDLEFENTATISNGAELEEPEPATSSEAEELFDLAEIAEESGIETVREVEIPVAEATETSPFADFEDEESDFMEQASEEKSSIEEPLSPGQDTSVENDEPIQEDIPQSHSPQQISIEEPVAVEIQKEIVEETITMTREQALNNSNDESAPRPVLNSLLRKPESKENNHDISRSVRSDAPAARNNSLSGWHAPEWTGSFSINYLDKLESDKAKLKMQMEELQSRMNTMSDRIADLENLKNALIAGSGEILIGACLAVLARLGWNATRDKEDEKELLLSLGNQPQSIVRIAYSKQDCDRAEIKDLAGSALEFWLSHEIEPKAILIANTWADTSPHNRSQVDFEEALREIASKKSLCLLSTLQLLGIYQDIELGRADPESVRRQLLETNGQLVGFKLENLATV